MFETSIYKDKGRSQSRMQTNPCALSPILGEVSGQVKDFLQLQIHSYIVLFKGENEVVKYFY